MSHETTRKVAVMVAAMLAGCNGDSTTLTSPVGTVADRANDVAPPNPPVIFLHYDYMVTPDGGMFVGDTIKNYAPDPATIDHVVEAFRRHGISLVIDPQHTEIPFQEIMMGPFGCPPNRICVDFFDLKATYFRPKGRQPWHYAIFAPLGYLGGQRVGGAADLEGSNILVSVFPPHPTCTLGTRVDFCQYRQAGTLMHELGHNLGLRHGGDDDENYKPNYISVMNYLFQGGISYSLPGDTYQFSPAFVEPTLADRERIVGIRLDYSDGALPPIDEHHLDERIGLGGSAANNSIGWYVGNMILDCSDYDFRFKYFHASAQPTDWNHNGQIESDVAVDVNWYWPWTQAGAPYPPFGVCPVLSVLDDYDDWTHVQRFLGTPGYLTGTLRPTTIVADPPGPKQ